MSTGFVGNVDARWLKSLLRDEICSLESCGLPRVFLVIDSVKRANIVNFAHAETRQTPPAVQAIRRGIQKSAVAAVNLT